MTPFSLKIITPDGVQFDGARITYGDTISEISVVSDVPTVLSTRTIHPGMHNLRPHAYYPAWRTAELPAGTYLFATTVFFSTKEKPQVAPEVKIDGNTVTVRFGDMERTVTV